MVTIMVAGSAVALSRTRNASGQQQETLRLRQAPRAGFDAVYRRGMNRKTELFRPASLPWPTCLK